MEAEELSSTKILSKLVLSDIIKKKGYAPKVPPGTIGA